MEIKAILKIYTLEIFHSYASVVDVRMSKPVENFYKHLFETDRGGYTWKQDLKRLRKTVWRITVCSFFYASEIKEGL